MGERDKILEMERELIARGCPPKEAREIVVEWLTEKGAEQYLLETSGVEMDVLEIVSRDLGMSFEEMSEKAIRYYLERGGSPPERNDRDQGDWWKDR
jgi:hypothetical protein